MSSTAKFTNADIPGETPVERCLMSLIVTLSSELSVLRERVDTLEQLIVSAGVFEQGAVDHFEPNEQQAARRSEQRQKLIRRVFQPVKQMTDAEAARLSQSS